MDSENDYIFGLELNLRVDIISIYLCDRQTDREREHNQYICVRDRERVCVCARD